MTTRGERHDERTGLEAVFEPHEPPPGGLARLRGRLREDGARRRGWRARPLSVALGVVAVAMIALVTVRLVLEALSPAAAPAPTVVVVVTRPAPTPRPGLAADPAAQRRLQAHRALAGADAAQAVEVGDGVASVTVHEDDAVVVTLIDRLER